MTTSTKTATNIKTLAEQSRAALGQAQLAFDENDSLIASVTRRLREMDQGWSQGDTSATATDRRAVQDELERAERLRPGLASRLKVARRQIVNESTALASAVLPSVLAAYDVNHRIETLASEVGHGEPPTMIVLQRVESIRDPLTGAFRGEVELIYRRSALHAPLDQSGVLTAMSEGGHVVELEHGVTTSFDNGAHVDRAVVKVLRAFDDLPLIAVPGNDPKHAKTYAEQLARAVEESFVTHNGAGKPLYEVAVTTGTTSTKPPTTKAGLTSTVLETSIWFPRLVLHDYATAAVETRLAQTIGHRYAGLGKCVTATRVSTMTSPTVAPPKRVGGAMVTVVATFNSRAA